MGKGETTSDPTALEDALKEKEIEEDHISLGSESEGDSDGGEIEISSSQATLKKATRGRKSKKKKRRTNLPGCSSRIPKNSQGNDKHPKHKKGGQDPKGATSSQASK